MIEYTGEEERRYQEISQSIFFSLLLIVSGIHWNHP